MPIVEEPSEVAANEVKNTYNFREPWLMDAVKELRPYFAKAALTIPDKLRCGFGLTTAGKKGTRKSECWPADASADAHFEIFISPDIAEPVEVLSVLIHSLVHACLPHDAGHGPKFKDAATRVGLTGKMRHPDLTFALGKALSQIAETLGPLPHARLDILAPILDRPLPVDRPKKQGTRLLKAECLGKGKTPCGYTVRLAAKWVKELGPPHCPKHGAMKVELPPDSDIEPAESESV